MSKLFQPGLIKVIMENSVTHGSLGFESGQTAVKVKSLSGFSERHDEGQL